jgi:hypothetical protein
VRESLLDEPDAISRLPAVGKVPALLGWIGRKTDLLRKQVKERERWTNPTKLDLQIA